jgi:argininosuccinate lyase
MANARRPVKRGKRAPAPAMDSRFSEPPAPEMVRVVSSRRMRETRASFHEELWNHQAHAIMLAEQGILRRAHAGRILQALEEIERIGPDRFPIEPGRGELLFSVEAYLEQRLGADIASRLHTGRSRADLYVCVERMVFREKLLALEDALAGLTGVLLQRAGEHVETVMPGYTLLQHAQPTTFAHYLLSFVDRFRRDRARLQAAYGRVDRSPMGAAVLSGTSFPVSRPRMAALLGFSGVVENTRDASTSRDHSLEAVAAATILMSNVMALAEDLILWSTYEFGMLELADGYSGTSSIMPQKKNPSALTRVRHLGAECVGNTVTVLTQLKTHSEQLNDLEATGPVVAGTLSTAADAVELLAGTVRSLRVKPEVMAALAGRNFLQAAQLAETIARDEDLGFREAHKIVARLVRDCLARGVAPADIQPAMVNEASIQAIGRPLRLSARTLRQCMDVRHIVRTRELPGGPGRRQVRRMLGRREAELELARTWLSEARDRLAAARRETKRLAARLQRS